MNKVKPYIWTGFLATIILIYGFIIKKDIAWYYLGNYEILYQYLLNGLSLAMGKQELGTLTNPGIVLVIFYALIIKITGWFRPSPISIDVLDNPELYLSVIGSIFIVMTSVFIFWLLTKINSKNQFSNSFLFLTLLLIPGAFFIQIAYPNPQMLVSILFLIQGVLLLDENNKKHFPFYNGLLSGISLATLYAAWPIILFNTLALKRTKNKRNYIITLSVSLIILLGPWLKPIIKNHEWFPIFLGNSISFEEESSSLLVLFLKNLWHFFLNDGIIAMSLVASTLLYLANKKLRITIITASLITIWLGIIGASAFHSKQNLLPFQIMSVFVLFLTISQIAKTTALPKFISKQGWFFVVFLLFIVLFYRNIKQHPFQFAKDYQRFNTVRYFDQNNDSETIFILNEDIPPQTKAFALYSGFTSCKGNAKDGFENDLANLYPNIVFFSEKNGLFDWNGSLSKSLYLTENNNGLIYWQQTDSTSRTPTILQKKNLKLQKSFTNDLKHERVFNYSYSCSAITPDSFLICGFENFNGNNIWDDSKTKKLGSNAQQIDKKVSYHGNNSLKLTHDEPFALNFPINITTSKSIEVTVWRKSEEERGLIVVQGTESGFYQTSSRIIKKESDWEKLQISFDIEDHLINEKLRLYCWNNGEQDVWFDNLQINYFSAIP